MLVYAAKVLGEYGVEAMMAKSANSTESRPGIAQITIMQGGLGLCPYNKFLHVCRYNFPH